MREHKGRKPVHHPPLDDEQFLGCIDIFLRRLVLKYEQVDIDITTWLKLCDTFRHRVVVRGRWKLNAALDWFYREIEAEIRRQRIAGQ